jgi:hypothetical protein
MKRGAGVGGVPRRRPPREPSNFRTDQIDHSIFGDQQQKRNISHFNGISKSDGDPIEVGDAFQEVAGLLARGYLRILLAKKNIPKTSRRSKPEKFQACR